MLPILAYTCFAATARAEPWGADFRDGKGLKESGWANFIGAREGKPLVVFQGSTKAGKPAQNSVELLLDVSDTHDWFGGLFMKLPPLKDDFTAAEMCLRARVAGRNGSKLLIRLESSPENWLGVRVETPANGEWVDVNIPLTQAERRGTFNPKSNALRLVIALVNDGSTAEGGEKTGMLVSEIWLEKANEN
jgi:hypothetical protein